MLSNRECCCECKPCALPKKDLTFSLPGFFSATLHYIEADQIWKSDCLGDLGTTLITIQCIDKVIHLDYVFYFPGASCKGGEFAPGCHWPSGNLVLIPSTIVCSPLHLEFFCDETNDCTCWTGSAYVDE